MKATQVTTAAKNDNLFAGFAPCPSQSIRRAMRPRLFSICLGFVWLTAIGGCPWLVSAQMAAKGIIFPIYLESEPKALAVLRIQETFTEYQRHGFFRIGLLPRFVAKGVTLELRQTAQIATAMHEAGGAILGSKSAAYLDVREITIKLSADSTPRLQAHKLRFGEAGQWQFEDGVVFPDTTNQVCFLKGTLQTTGTSAGQFAFLQGDNSTVFSLFAPISQKLNEAENKEAH